MNWSVARCGFRTAAGVHPFSRQQQCLGRVASSRERDRRARSFGAGARTVRWQQPSGFAKPLRANGGGRWTGRAAMPRCPRVTAPADGPGCAELVEVTR